MQNRLTIDPCSLTKTWTLSERPMTKKALEPKGSASESAPDPLLSVVCPFPAQPLRQRKYRGCYRPCGSKYISIPQATNIIEAVKFAKSIDLPLVAHLTLHWSGTVAFDDPDGSRFAKVREGLSKVLLRRGIPPAWVWCRECKAHTDIVHCHLLFHLPAEYRTGAKLDEIEGRTSSAWSIATVTASWASSR